MESLLSRMKALGSGLTRGLIVAALFVVYGIGAIGGYALSVAGVTGATMALTSTPAQAVVVVACVAAAAGSGIGWMVPLSVGAVVVGAAVVGVAVVDAIAPLI